jgi:transposase
MRIGKSVETRIGLCMAKKIRKEPSNMVDRSTSSVQAVVYDNVWLSVFNSWGVTLMDAI